MIRHPALVPLSRDHHLALLLARAIQKAASVQLRGSLPAGVEALVKHVCLVFASELEGHFCVEEELLVEAVRGIDFELDALCQDVVREHAVMRDLVRQLSEPDLSDSVTESLLDELGKTLESHVRSEERALYPRVERALGESGLSKLGEAIQQRVNARAATSRN